MNEWVSVESQIGRPDVNRSCEFHEIFEGYVLLNQARSQRGGGGGRGESRGKCTVSSKIFHNYVIVNSNK